MSKYRSRKTGGFDSKKEAERFFTLRRMEQMGEIEDLQVQVPYLLIPTQYIDGKCQERSVKYIADFVYKKGGETVVEDVKGYRKGGAYAMFVIKRKLMLLNYGISVKEI